MTSGGNSFNDFPEIVPNGGITTKIEQIFLVFSSVAVNSTDVTLIQHGTLWQSAGTPQRAAVQGSCSLHK